MDSGTIFTGGSILLLAIAIGLDAVIRLGEWWTSREVSARLILIHPRLLELARHVETLCEILESGQVDIEGKGERERERVGGGGCRPH